MTIEQNKAIKSLERSLKKCKQVGLRGHVFEGSLCVCPEDIEPQEDWKDYNSNKGIRFEDTINSKGKFLNQHGMHWDGATA